MIKAMWPALKLDMKDPSAEVGNPWTSEQPKTAKKRSRSPRVRWPAGSPTSIVIEYEPESAEEEAKYESFRRVEDCRMQRRYRRESMDGDGSPASSVAAFASLLHCSEVLLAEDDMRAAAMYNRPSKQIRSAVSPPSTSTSPRMQRGRRLVQSTGDLSRKFVGGTSQQVDDGLLEAVEERIQAHGSEERDANSRKPSLSSLNFDPACQLPPPSHAPRCLAPSSQSHSEVAACTQPLAAGRGVEQSG